MGAHICHKSFNFLDVAFTFVNFSDKVKKTPILEKYRIAENVYNQPFNSLLVRGLSKAANTRCDLSATILLKLVDLYLIAFKFGQ